MRLPTVIRAGSQPTRRRQRPRLDPAALTRSDGLLPLRCTANRPRPDGRRYLAGELDTGSAPFLAEYLREQTATPPAELVLDLSEVTLVAAARLALIVTALNNDDGINGRLHLIGVTGNRLVACVLQLTGLMQILDVHDQLQAPLNAVHPS